MRVRFTIRTLIIIVAIVALDLAGLFYGPLWVCAACVVLTASFPVLAFLVYLARTLGLNTMFR